MQPPMYTPSEATFAPQRYACARIRVLSLCGVDPARALLAIAPLSVGSVQMLWTIVPLKTAMAPLQLAQRELGLVVLAEESTLQEGVSRLAAWRHTHPVALGARIFQLHDDADGMLSSPISEDVWRLPLLSDAGFAARAGDALARFAAELVAAVPALGAQMDAAVAGPIMTPGDADPALLSASALATWQRRQAARRDKQRADLLLLDNQPVTALPALAAALRNLRGHNDMLWVAGTLESMAVAAHLLFATGDPQYKLADLFGRYREAALAYARVKEAGTLRVDVLLRLAACVLTAGLKADLSRELSLLFEFDSLTATTEETLLNLLALGHLHASMEMPRKAAYFFHEAAFIYVNEKIACCLKVIQFCAAQVKAYASWNLAFDVLMSVTYAHGMSDLPLATHHVSEQGLHPRRAFARIEGWPMLQARLLYDLAVVAGRSAQPGRQVPIVGYFTRQIADSQARAMFLPALLNDLKALPASSLLPHGLRGVPVIGAVLPVLASSLSCASGQTPVAVSQTPVVAQRSVFIYSALRRETKAVAAARMVLVSGELAAVLVRLHNPLSTELVVEQLRLVTDHPDFIARFLPFVKLAPQSVVTVTMCGTPQHAGPLAIVGVAAHALRVDSMHPTVPLAGDVLPAMPMMTLEAGLAAQQLGAAQAVLLAGEAHEFVWTLENKSPVAVGCICVSLTVGSTTIESVWQPEHDARSPLRLELPMATIELPSLAPLLPLLPGQRCVVRLRIRGGIPGAVSINVGIKYGGADWRPPANSGAGTRNEPLTKYYRELRTVVNLTTQPVLKVFEVTLFEGPLGPTLVFQCQNETPFALDMHCATDANGLTRDRPATSTLLQSFGISTQTLALDSQVQDEARAGTPLILFCEWSLVSQGRAGVVKIPVPLAAQHAVANFPGPLAVLLQSLEPCVISVGNTHTFLVQVRARAELAARLQQHQQIGVSVRAYQEFQNGARESVMHGKVMWLGPTTLNVPLTLTLNGYAVAALEFTGLFLCTGEFTVAVQASMVPSLYTEITVAAAVPAKGKSTGLGANFPQTSVDVLGALDAPGFQDMSQSSRPFAVRVI